MATRRSRIKAVANLPARRNRPANAVETAREDVDSSDLTQESGARVKLESVLDKSVSSLDAERGGNTEADETVIQSSKANVIVNSTTVNVRANASGKSTSSPPTDQVSNLPDRKSVIVNLEKDRKSVIVNRSVKHNLSSNEADAIKQVAENVVSVNGQEEAHSPGVTEDVADKNVIEETAVRATEEVTENVVIKENTEEVVSKSTQSSLKESESITRHVVDSPVKESTSTSPTKPSGSSTSEGNGAQPSRGPFRSRRIKPTVNLPAASRKRSGHDGALSSPCSPPPNKFQPPEFPQQKKNEAVDKSPAKKQSGIKDPQPSPATDTPTSKNSGQNQQLPMLPPPVPALNTTNAGATSIVPNPFHDPVVNVMKSPNVPTDTQSEVDAQSSVQKDATSAKRKQSSSAQRAAAARRNLKSRLSCDKAPIRSTLTMFDLIFYNPSNNPMKSNGDSGTKARSRQSSISSIATVNEERLLEESVDDVDNDKTETDKESEETAMPVPQVKVGPDGSLILDEQSLIIETTGTQKSREDLERSEVVIDNGSSYGHYKRTKRSKDWSDDETKKFYRALNVVGTDFSLMATLFKNRTRRELKLKFKKEERISPALINKALGEHLDFDISDLEKECALEEEEERKLAELEKEKAAEKDKEKNSTPVEGDATEQSAKSKPQTKKPLAGKKPKTVKKKSLLSAEIEPAPAENEDASLKPVKKVSKGKRKQKDLEVLTAQTEKSNKRIREGNNIAGVEYEDLAMGVGPEKKKIKKENKMPNKLAGPVSGPQPGQLFAEGVCHTSSQPNAPRKPTLVINSSVKKVPGIVQLNSDSTFVQPSSVTVPKQDIILMSPGSGKVIQSELSGKTVMTPSPRIVIAPMKPQTPVGDQTVNTLYRVVQTPSTSHGSQTPKMHVVQAVTPTMPPTITPVRPKTSVTSAGKATEVSGMKTVYRVVQTPCASSGSTTKPQAQQMHVVQAVTPTNPPLTPSPSNAIRMLPGTPNLPRMEPGSLIVLKSPFPQNPERHILQVYMVTNTPPGAANGTAGVGVGVPVAGSGVPVNIPISAPLTPFSPGINLFTAPSACVSVPVPKSPAVNDDSDSEKVLTTL